MTTIFRSEIAVCQDHFSDSSVLGYIGLTLQMLSFLHTNMCLNAATKGHLRSRTLSQSPSKAHILFTISMKI